MKESLLGRRPVAVGSVSGFLLFIGTIVLVLSSVSFYVALSNYLIDERYSVSSLYRPAQANTIRAESIERGIELDKQNLDNYTDKCEETLDLIAEDSARLDYRFIQLYRQMNDTISAVNTTCASELESMTRTLMQIINMTNATSHLVGHGVCQFNPIAGNGTSVSTTNYQYRQLLLNGLEFYFYRFSASPVITTYGLGARIEHCSPGIFKSTATRFFGPSVQMGQNALEIYGANYTMQVSEGFQVWVDLF